MPRAYKFTRAEQTLIRRQDEGSVMAQGRCDVCLERFLGQQRVAVKVVRGPLKKRLANKAIVVVHDSCFDPKTMEVES